MNKPILFAHLSGEFHAHGEDITVILVGFAIVTFFAGLTYAMRHDSNR